MKKELTPRQVDNIINVICYEFCINDIAKKSNSQNITEARKIIMYFCYVLNYYNRAELARALGITPSMVNYSCIKITDYIDSCKMYKEKMDRLIEIIEESNCYA